MKNLLLFFLLIGFIAACSDTEEDYVPKARGFHRIELPTQEYVKLSGEKRPYSFEHSIHAQVLNDSSFMAEKYWIEVYYPTYKANIDISYKIINSQKDFEEYVNDCHTLVFKHNKKASAIRDFSITTKNGLTAKVFELEGDVPTQFQFYVTDSVSKFLRADLYFPSTQNDSLAPVINFIKKDMFHMLETLEWQK